MQNRLLVVDKDQRDEIFYRALLEEGYTFRCVIDSSKVARVMSRMSYDLLIVRWQPPIEDGTKVWSRVRAMGNPIPILVLSVGMRAVDQVRCLDSGADDYIGKPYHLEVVLARIRALLRRGAIGTAHARVGPLTLDRLNRQAILDGKSLLLSPREYALLEYLVARRGRTVSRSELVRELHARSRANGATTLVDASVATLRGKLRHHAALIETVRHSGYRLSNGG